MPSGHPIRTTGQRAAVFSRPEPARAAASCHPPPSRPRSSRRSRSCVADEPLRSTPSYRKPRVRAARADATFPATARHSMRSSRRWPVRTPSRSPSAPPRSEARGRGRSDHPVSDLGRVAAAGQEASMPAQCVVDADAPRCSSSPSAHRVGDHRDELLSVPRVVRRGSTTYRCISGSWHASMIASTSASVGADSVSRR